MTGQQGNSVTPKPATKPGGGHIVLILAHHLHIQACTESIGAPQFEGWDRSRKTQTAKDTSGCGFTHEVQEKQQPVFGSCRQLDGIEIGHVIALPEAREISGWLDPLQVFLFLCVCVLMDLRRRSAGSRRHNATHIHTSTEISVQIRMSSAQHQRANSSNLAFSIHHRWPCPSAHAQGLTVIMQGKYRSSDYFWRQSSSDPQNLPRRPGGNVSSLNFVTVNLVAGCNARSRPTLLF